MVQPFLEYFRPGSAVIQGRAWPQLMAVGGTGFRRRIRVGCERDLPVAPDAWSAVAAPNPGQAGSRSPALTETPVVLPGGASGHCQASLYLQEGW